jgi:hypothetical protein
MEKVDYIQDVKSKICLFTMEGDTHLIKKFAQEFVMDATLSLKKDTTS